MKRLVQGTVAVAALIAAGAADAADMVVKAPPPPPIATDCFANDIVKANNQLSVDFVETSVKYGPEIITPNSAGIGPVGVPLDGLKGWVPGMRGIASVMTTIGPLCNIYLSGSFTHVNGHTDYWSNSGFLPTNVNGARIDDWDFRVGKGFNVGQNAMITPYFGAGTRWWDNLLNGQFGYNEVYKHAYTGGGLLLQYSPVPGWVLSANGLIGRTFDASQTSSLSPGGTTAICVCVFPLGTSTTYEIGGSVDYAITEHVHASAGVDYTYFKYGQSPVITHVLLPFGTVDSIEPNSKTSDTTVSVGVGYHW